MSTVLTARQALRVGTSVHHARIDVLFSSFDLTNRDKYERFLTIQVSAYLPIESALDRSGAAAVVPDWPNRRRSHLLAADLAALGLSVPETAEAAAFDGVAAILGGIYVLEGSRLGGALLKRSVSPDLPAAFLAATNPGGWRSFVSLLDRTLLTPEQIAVATAAATRVFRLFEDAAKLHCQTKCTDR